MAAKSAADIVSEMILAMRVADPSLDTSVGSVVRKIFDVVAEQVAPAYAVNLLTDFSTTVDAKSGADLDDFCKNYGFYRLPAKRATGTVTFQRPAPAEVNVPIPASVTISSGTTPSVSFLTTSPTVIAKGSRTASVPIQAVTGGEAGNLPAGTLTVLSVPISGVGTTMSQTAPTSGGTEAESDEALRERFKKTAFRSLAGTEDMFLGVATEDSTPDDDTDTVANQATIIGASRRWKEQIQIVNGVGTSTLPSESIKFVYSDSAFVGGNLDSGAMLTRDVHYTFDPAARPPTVTTIGDGMENNAVYELEYEYIPTASRNDVDAGILNRIDIWVSGVRPESTSEVTYVRDNLLFSGSSDSPYFLGNYRRSDGLTVPEAGNLFLPLSWGPIVTFPESISVGGDVYIRDTDFWIVHDISAFGLSSRSRFGLEFISSRLPVDGSLVSIGNDAGYTYNRVPRDVQERAERWKLTTTDVMVHAARQVRIVVNLAIMYLPGYSREVVDASIDATLARWVASLGFRSVVQASDILAAVHNVSGVDNVRFLNSDERVTGQVSEAWGLQVVGPEGDHLYHSQTASGSPARAADLILAENQVPVLFDVRLQPKAQNSFGEG